MRLRRGTLIFHHGRHRNAFGGTEGAVESAFHAFQLIIAPSKTSVYGRWANVSEMPEGLIRAAFRAAEGVSEHSVVKISTKNSEEPILYKIVSVIKNMLRKDGRSIIPD